jgi:hypothetical protein
MWRISMRLLLLKGGHGATEDKSGQFATGPAVIGMQLNRAMLIANGAQMNRCKFN